MRIEIALVSIVVSVAAAAAGCSSSTKKEATTPGKPPAVASGTLIDVKGGSVNGLYKLSLTRAEVEVMQGGVRGTGDDDSWSFEDGRITLSFGFGGGDEVCAIYVSGPASTPESPSVGDPLETWELYYGKAAVEEATGEMYFEGGGGFTVTVGDGAVQSVRLGGCGE